MQPGKIVTKTPNSPKELDMDDTMWSPTMDKTQDSNFTWNMDKDKKNGAKSDEKKDVGAKENKKVKENLKKLEEGGKIAAIQEKKKSIIFKYWMAIVVILVVLALLIAFVVFLML